MKSKEVTLCGKTVGLAYCYATEIFFSNLAGVTIDELNTEKPEHVINLIIAAMFAYYRGDEKKCPIKDDDLMYQSSFPEMLDAVKAIYSLRAEWATLPENEPKDDAGKEELEKNV